MDYQEDGLKHIYEKFQDSLLYFTFCFSPNYIALC